MLRISVINRTKSRVDENLLKLVVEKVLKQEMDNVSVNVVLVGEKRIRDLNRTYRKIDLVTDVLTFVYGDEDLFGEIFLCPKQIEKNAKKFGQPYMTEFKRVLIHSCLHLNGYDHELTDNNSTEMFAKQERYLREVDNLDS